MRFVTMRVGINTIFTNHGAEQPEAPQWDSELVIHDKWPIVSCCHAFILVSGFLNKFSAVKFNPINPAYNNMDHW